MVAFMEAQKKHQNVSYTNFEDLTQQIKFQSTEGKIWLGEQRVLLMQVSAMAAFRRELLNTVGLERSKGFFLRLGYQSGLKDAELARKLRPDSNELDIFLAGPQLHSLKGMVKVVPLELDIDQSTGQFYGELEWIDSYEVEICKTEIGLIDEPACWSLIGYACAYASSFMGREILFQEITCRGCGDDRCIIVGKPAEDWENYEEFRKYFISDPIVEELYDLQSNCKNIKADLKEQQNKFYGIGQSSSYRKICDTIDKAAQSKVAVLLLGETGVGKEVIAKSVHLRSDRANRPFVAVNCAAIPPDLIESELFGADKGAYTGASHSRQGRFERANGGTIFLDEVIELNPRAQASLLRVLQEGEIERVGGDQTKSVNVRIIAATNEDLAQAVKEGRFRADLYFRLNVFPARIPPLRERKEDIPLLIEHFLSKFHTEYNKRTLGLSDKALAACNSYNWPGNIRELENIIERGVILTNENDSVNCESLFSVISLDNDSNDEIVNSDGKIVNNSSDHNWVDCILESGLSLEDVELTLLKTALEKSKQNVSASARLLKISRPALSYRLKKFGLL